MLPKTLKLDNRDWWVKPIEMLVHNWALIEETFCGTVTIYFFHDAGAVKGGGAENSPYRLGDIQGLLAVVDSLDFKSRADAVAGLSRNGFFKLDRFPGP